MKDGPILARDPDRAAKLVSSSPTLTTDEHSLLSRHRTPRSADRNGDSFLEGCDARACPIGQSSPGWPGSEITTAVFTEKNDVHATFLHIITSSVARGEDIHTYSARASALRADDRNLLPRDAQLMAAESRLHARPIPPSADSFCCSDEQMALAPSDRRRCRRMKQDRSGDWRRTDGQKRTETIE
jgi:hypothetical protein